MSKVISLMQPWAQLVMIGQKTVETRSWKTHWRGPLLIHASAGSSPEAQMLTRKHEVHWQGMTLPTGAIIGQVRLRNCIKAKDFIKQYKEMGWQGDLKRELLMGDFSGDRWVWLLDEPVLFRNPISAKGKLSIWDHIPSDELADQMKY